MNPCPTTPPHDPDQDSVSVSPVSIPTQEGDAYLNPTLPPAPTSGQRNPEAPIEESHPSGLPDNRFMGASSPSDSSGHGRVAIRTSVTEPPEPLHTITIEGAGVERAYLENMLSPLRRVVVDPLDPPIQDFRQGVKDIRDSCPTCASVEQE